MTPRYKIVFKCCTKSPVEIFREGFQPEQTSKVITYYKSHTNPKTTVRLFSRMSAATYFPLPVNGNYNQSIWVYVVCVNLGNASKDLIFAERNACLVEGQSHVTNLHGRRVIESVKREKEAIASPSKDLFFLNELVVQSVKPKNILCAIHCLRKINFEFGYPIGGSYILGDKITPNTTINSHIPQEIINAANVFLEKEREEAKGKMKLPMANPDDCTYGRLFQPNPSTLKEIPLLASVPLTSSPSQ